MYQVKSIKIKQDPVYLLIMGSTASIHFEIHFSCCFFAEIRILVSHMVPYNNNSTMLEKKYYLGIMTWHWTKIKRLVNNNTNESLIFGVQKFIGLNSFFFFSIEAHHYFKQIHLTSVLEEVRKVAKKYLKSAITTTKEKKKNTFSYLLPIFSSPQLWRLCCGREM